MLNWLYNQVIWLIDTASAAYNWIINFISNPYPTLRNLLDWVYNRAVSFANAVKLEIANWTYSLFQNLQGWITWFNDLYNRVIKPSIDSLWAQLQNIASNVWSAIKPIFDQAVANLWSWIQWLDGLIKAARGELANFRNWIVNQINNLIGDLRNQISNLRAMIEGIDLGKLYNQVGQLLWWVQNAELWFIKTLSDTLLDKLEELLAEAME